MIPDINKKNPNYPFWSLEKRKEYDKTAQLIKEHGHIIKGIRELRLGVSYTIGASNSIGAEFVSFFPLKGEGINVITKIINKLVKLIKNDPEVMKSQIFNNKDLYGLPFGFVILPEKNKQFAESEYACQLQSDALLSDFSSRDHKLILLLFTDKYGKMPWEEGCNNYWPYICPDSLVRISQKILTGKTSNKNRLTIDEDDYFTIVGDVKYPLLVELSPQDLQYGVKIGKEKWMRKFPKGNFDILMNTVISLFKNEVVVTKEGNNYLYFDKQNIPKAFSTDFPNELFMGDAEVKNIIGI